MAAVQGHVFAICFRAQVAAFIVPDTCCVLCTVFSLLSLSLQVRR